MALIPKVSMWVVKYYSYEGEDFTKPFKTVKVMAPTKVLALLQCPPLMPGQWRTAKSLGPVRRREIAR